MAVSAFTPFNIAKKKLVDGTIDLDSHTFKIALTTTTQAIDATFAGTSTDCRYSDLTNEASNGSGYTTGGVALSGVTLTRSVGTVKFDSTDPTWAALTKSFRYAVVYDDTSTNKDLLGFVDLNTGGGNITVTASDYTIIWDAAGIFTLA